MYHVKCFLKFYSSFAKSVITYGLLIYGSAAETNLKKKWENREFRKPYLKKINMKVPTKVLRIVY